MRVMRTDRGTFASATAALASARGAVIVTETAPRTIHHDFEEDVLERLQKLGASACGVPVVGVHAALDGSVKVMCEGVDQVGRPRKFALRFNLPLLAQRKYLGDPIAVSEVACQLLAGATPAQLPA